MTHSNLAVVFGPNLAWSRDEVRKFFIFSVSFHYVVAYVTGCVVGCHGTHQHFYYVAAGEFGATLCRRFRLLEVT